MDKIQVDYSRTDLRGKLTQVSSKEWRQTNVLEINRGSTFGGHYHKKKRELFYVIQGTVVMTILKMKGGSDFRASTSYTLLPGDVVIVKPFESHTLFAPDEKAILVELLSKPWSEHDTFSVFEEEENA